MADDLKTYILELKNGNLRRVTVPADWKVTFGPLIPADRHSGGGCLALRFYESKEKQRAIFTDVKSFRASDIPIEERVTKTQTKHMQKQTPEGVKDVLVEARVTEWRNPDDDQTPDDDFMAIEDMTVTEGD